MKRSDKKKPKKKLSPDEKARRKLQNDLVDAAIEKSRRLKALDGDSLTPPRIERNDGEIVEAQICVLLSHHWDTFDSKHRLLALQFAKAFGGLCADNEPDATGGPSDYRRICIGYAFHTAKVINDVEDALWMTLESDPRYDAFLEGFTERKQITG